MAVTAETRARLALIERETEEIITHQELALLLESGQTIRHYIGFEISGKIHLGTGLMCMSKVRDLMEAGVECSVLLADWHTWINDKLGGDREIIKRVAGGYFMEGLKASLKCLGGDPSRLRFVLGTDLYHHNDDYWATVIEVSKNTTLARMQRSISILGRQLGEAVDFAKLIYPAMQVADIFIQGVHLAHAGMDQRKAHVIARDTALHLKTRPLLNAQGKTMKPIAIHHPLILGLRKPPLWPPQQQRRQDLWLSMKMSKSDPSSAIFIHDPPEEIRRKIRKAFCPPQEVEFNPILDWARRLIFGAARSTLHVDRAPQYGGPITFERYEDLEAVYRQGGLHPMDLKEAVGERLIQILAPAREHFQQPHPAAMLAELDSLLAAEERAAP